MKAFSVYCTLVQALSAAVAGALAWAAWSGSSPVFCIAGIAFCGVTAWVFDQLKPVPFGDDQ